MDNNEIDDQVDLDDDNYVEEDEDVEEQMEDEVEAEEHSGEDQHEDSRSGDSGNEQLSDTDAGDDTIVESVKVDEDFNAVNNSFDNEEHIRLLSLPSHGSEVFIGGIPRDVSEEDLRDLCEPFGEIFEVRIMRNRDTGESKGFAFVAFKTKDVAQKAIEVLHSKEFKGRTIRCSLSETKYRLFIGNVPKSLSDNDFKKVIDETGPGAEHIELIKDPQNSSKNRGFAFIEYYNNACADYSRQKMSNASFKLDGNTPTVTWADPKISSDHSAAAAQVKALYVTNIPENTTTGQVKELFEKHGEVTKVVLPPSKSGGKGNFGFIHFADRSSALKAIKDTEKYEINGQTLEVVLAKPQTEKKFDVLNASTSFVQPNFISSSGYGAFPMTPYGGGAAGGFQQPMIYGRGPMPSGMQMVPMVLPDGRIGYVLQQPGMQMPQVRPKRNDRGSGGGGRGGSGGGGGRDDGRPNRRYRPY